MTAGDEFRLATARDGIKGYDEWLNNPNPAARISPEALSSLAMAARWLVEMLDQADVTVGEC